MSRVLMLERRRAANSVGFDLGTEENLAGRGMRLVYNPEHPGYPDMETLVPFDKCQYEKRQYRTAWTCGYLDGAGK